MATKQEYTLNYIRNLKVGAKISIKGLAKELSISEGTAYHAIKKAEQDGLVVTLPKAGTTRIEYQPKKSSDPITIKKLIHAVGAAVLTKNHLPDFVISHFCVADSGADGLERMLANGGRGAVCIMGERPQIQKKALSLGAHLLLTGGCLPEDDVLKEAENYGGMIMQTGLSTLHVLNLLGKAVGNAIPIAPPMSVGEWMRSAQYLLKDDLVIDGCQLFNKLLVRALPVVDHDMRLFGLLNMAEAHQADPTQRVDRVCSTEMTLPVMAETDSVALAAKHLLSDGRFPVLVVKEERLVGILTVSELLKFYQYYGGSFGGGSQAVILNGEEKLGAKDEEVYNVHVSLDSKAEVFLQRKQLVSIMMAAVDRYCKEKNIIGGIQNIVFFSMEELVAEKTQVSVKPLIFGDVQQVLTFQIRGDGIVCAEGNVTIQIERY